MCKKVTQGQKPSVLIEKAFKLAKAIATVCDTASIYDFRVASDNKTYASLYLPQQDLKDIMAKSRSSEAAHQIQKLSGEGLEYILCECTVNDETEHQGQSKSHKMVITQKGVPANYKNDNNIIELKV